MAVATYVFLNFLSIHAQASRLKKWLSRVAVEPLSDVPLERVSPRPSDVERIAVLVGPPGAKGENIEKAARQPGYLNKDTDQNSCQQTRVFRRHFFFAEGCHDLVSRSERVLTV